MEKMPETSNFSFFHVVLYPSQNKIHFLSVIFILLSANFDQSKNFSFGKELIRYVRYTDIIRERNIAYTESMYMEFPIHA